jgi:hypothetical protein
MVSAVSVSAAFGVSAVPGLVVLGLVVKVAARIASSVAVVWTGASLATEGGSGKCSRLP